MQALLVNMARMTYIHAYVQQLADTSTRIKEHARASPGAQVFITNPEAGRLDGSKCGVHTRTLEADVY